MIKKFFVETVELKNAEQAQQLLDRENAKKKRLTAALWMSAIASVMIIVGFLGLPTIGGLGVILAVPAYIMGGFGNTLITMLKMILVGWKCLIFLFPINILPAAFLACVGAMLFISAPVFYVGINYLQHRKNIEVAQSMLENSAKESPAVE